MSFLERVTSLDFYIWQGVLVLLFLIALFLSKKLMAKLEKIAAKTETTVDDTLIPSLKGPLKLLIFLGYIMAILSSFGMSMNFVAALTGVASFVILQSLTGFLVNLVASCRVLGTKPYKIGETVVIDGVEGKVVKITLSKTILSDVDKKWVHINHDKVMKSNLTTPAGGK